MLSVITFSLFLVSYKMELLVSFHFKDTELPDASKVAKASDECAGDDSDML